jgi:galactokinase
MDLRRRILTAFRQRYGADPGRVNLVAEQTTKTFACNLEVGYTQETGLKPEIYICRATDGARVELE